MMGGQIPPKRPPVPIEGRKDDAGKPRWSLIPWASMREVLGVLEYGARKYDVDNWQRVPDARQRYFDAGMRHMLAWWQGERKDPESGWHHLAHAACCMLFLIWCDDQKEADHACR